MEPSALTLERYEIASAIASGAHGCVFAARDVRTGRNVVVKIFPGNEGRSYRFWRREMRLALRFRHQNIVACLDLGFDTRAGVWVLVFERAQSGSLRRALVQEQSFDHNRLLAMLTKLGSALAYAHSHRVLHRDVKPENIVLSESPTGEEPMLTDFGIGAGESELAAHTSWSSAYGAPEVAAMETATRGSDLFSLGLVMLELVLGHHPSPVERAEFALRHGASGLYRLIAMLLASDPKRRLDDARLLVWLAQQVQKNPLCSFAAERFAHGSVALCDGEILGVYSADGRLVRHRVPRATRLLHSGSTKEAAGTPYASTPRRVVELGETVTSALSFEISGEVVAYHSETQQAVVLRDGALWLAHATLGAEPVAEARVPAGWNTDAAFIFVPQKEKFLITVVGALSGFWVENGRAEGVEFPAPAYRSCTTYGREYLICGDAHFLFVIDPFESDGALRGAPSLRVFSRQNAAVDRVRTIALDGSITLWPDTPVAPIGGKSDSPELSQSILTPVHTFERGGLGNSVGLTLRAGGI